MKPNRYLLLLATWTLAVGLTAERIVTIYRSDPQIDAIAYVSGDADFADDAYLNTIMVNTMPWTQVDEVTFTSNWITSVPATVTLKKEKSRAHKK